MVALLEAIAARAPGDGAAVTLDEAALRLGHRIVGRSGDRAHAQELLAEAVLLADKEHGRRDRAVLSGVLLAGSLLAGADEPVLEALRQLFDLLRQQFPRPEVQRISTLGQGLAGSLLTGAPIEPVLQQAERDAAADEDPFLRALTLTCTAWLRRLDGDDVPAQRALSEAYAAVQHMSGGPGQAWLLAAVAWIAAWDRAGRGAGTCETRVTRPGHWGA
ncbi:hypothetical protein ACQEVZ_53335 [Dactylosporangium sp. CA-152071]|uniref:hypothetical protein n=1 Tax=Dactylosporangium sp. CA-152071 TaxID=3239933 RepID=UPI003D91B738